jgi:hypothetical protein
VKTISLKKVSAVAVASLGFGLLSVVPAQAAPVEVASAGVASYNLKSATANTLTANAAQIVHLGMVANATAKDATSTNNLKISTMGYISSAPSGGIVSLAAATLTGPLTNTGLTVTLAGGKLVSSAANDTDIAASTTTATGTNGIGKFTFTPTKAGVYTITVWNDADGGGDFDITEVSQVISLTIAADYVYSNSLSTAYINGSNAASAVGTSTTDALPISVSKSLANANRAIVTISLFDSGNNAATTGNSVSAELTGPGAISFSTADSATTNTCDGVGRTTPITARVISATAADAVGTMYVCSDGTSGVSSLKIMVTDAAGVKTTLATKTITFYGSVAKLTATANYTVLKAAGGVTGGSVTGATATDYLDLANRVNATDVPAVVVKATDSAGTVVGGLTILGLSSSTTVANSWSVANSNNDATNGCSEDVLSAANVYSSGGTGFYNCALSTPTSAKSGDKVTITFRLLDPAGDGTTYLTAPLDFTVGGTTPGTETLSFDKASYAPGEAMTVTRTCKDTSGNPCADGTAAPAVTFNKAVGGTAPGASVYVGGTKSSTSSKGVASVFAPTASGSFTGQATSGNAAGSALTATATVTDANAGANAALLTQIDALNAKIVALNALIAKIMKKLGVK